MARTIYAVLALVCCCMIGAQPFGSEAPARPGPSAASQRPAESPAASVWCKAGPERSVA
jgi:hypothetical protein